MFLVIGLDPVRYRMAMLPAFVVKGGFAVAIPILYALGRAPAVWLGFASMDAAWLVLFVIAFLMTPEDQTRLDGKSASQSESRSASGGEEITEDFDGGTINKRGRASLPILAGNSMSVPLPPARVGKRSESVV